MTLNEKNNKHSWFDFLIWFSQFFFTSHRSQLSVLLTAEVLKQKKQVNLPYCCVIWCRRAGLSKILLFYWAAKDLAQELSCWQSYRDRQWVPSLIICPAYWVLLLNLCVYINEKMSLMFENFIFALQSLAWICKPLIIMPVSTMTQILDSLENIRLRKEKSYGLNPLQSILAWISCCIQNFNTPAYLKLFLFFEGPDLQFCTKLGDRIMKQVHWTCNLALQERHTMTINGILPLARQPFFCFFGSKWLQYMESRKNMVWIHMDLLGLPVAIAVTDAALAGSFRVF